MQADEMFTLGISEQQAFNLEWIKPGKAEKIVIQNTLEMFIHCGPDWRLGKP